MPTPPIAAAPSARELFDRLAPLDAGAREVALAEPGLPAQAVLRVRDLLAHHDRVEAQAATRSLASAAGNFLARPAAEQLAQTLAPAAAAAPSAVPGQRLGAWEVLRLLGSGGMGDVHEARRADGQFEGRAAIKVLKRGMDSAAVLARFALERQALARLNHPHIARLLDAGASAEGLPYFVMELVDGRPIHEVALGEPLERRLELFLQLADAVAHAHRERLVHRDLKPSNVLVDREGRVKLLDFGIAKALDPLEAVPGAAAPAAGASTLGGHRPYTPHYASPEQVRGEPAGPATDIYGLGVLLYQMLTGTRPTGRRASTGADAARSVLEEAPTRPSRLSPLEAADPAWLATRRRLEGDLDNVLLKALEKAPTRRYVSVEAMAADVQAFLEGRPVSARTSSIGYRLAKFVQRQRLAVAAAAVGALGLSLGLAAALLQARPLAALGALGLGAGLVLALVQARRASVAREKAESHLEQARAIARDMVERHAEAIQHLPGGVALHTRMLEDVIARLQVLARDREGDPWLAAEQAQAHARIAHLQAEQFLLEQSDFDAAERHVALALPLFELGARVQGARPEYVVWWARAWRARMAAARARGDLPAALAAVQRQRDILAACRPPEGSRWPVASELELLSQLGSVHIVQAQLLFTVAAPHLNRPDDAEVSLRAAERLYAGLVADGRGDYQERHQLATVQGGLMLIARHRGDLAGAAALGESALALRQKNLAEQPGLVPLRSACASEAINLSWVLSETPGSAARALALAQAGQAELERLAQENPATPAWRDSALRANLHVARAHLALGQAALALPLIEALLDPTLEPARRGGAERIAWSGLEHALALHGLGDQDRAHEALHTAQQALGALAGGPAPNLAWTQKRAAEVARLLADPDAAAAAPGRTS